MKYKHKDYITGVELTKDNFMRCLYGWLDKIKVVDKDVAESLIWYIDWAFEVGGAKLAKEVVGVLMEDLYCRYY